LFNAFSLAIYHTHKLIDLIHIVGAYVDTIRAIGTRHGEEHQFFVSPEQAFKEEESSLSLINLSGGDTSITSNEKVSIVVGYTRESLG
jgi:hypothetical protein